MEGDTITVLDTTAVWSGPILTDSTIAIIDQWNYSRDSTLYHGSGFWFQEVVQYFRQRDSFGFQRHQAIQRPEKIASESLMLGLILFEVFLVAFLLKRGLKLISRYNKISFPSADKASAYPETSQTAGFSQFLWMLTLIVFSLMGQVLVNSSPAHLNYSLDSLFMLRLFVYTFLFFILQNLLYRLVGNVFFTPTLTNRWIANNKTILFFYAMILTPVLIGAEIGSITNGTFILYWALSFLVIAKFWMFLKSIRIFSIDKGNFFYLILYLCALEILPILLYYKGLFLL
jgi:hypothetical protein